jgi:hypothetical protein
MRLGAAESKPGTVRDKNDFYQERTVASAAASAERVDVLDKEAGHLRELLLSQPDLAVVALEHAGEPRLIPCRYASTTDRFFYQLMDGRRHLGTRFR